MKKFLRGTLFLLAALTASAEKQDLPLGIEFVAGIRSTYLNRGFDLADDLIDLQLQSNIRLEKDLFLNVVLWQGAEISGDFQEFGAAVGVGRTYDEYTFSAEIGYTDYDNSVFESGTEFSVGAERLFENKDSLALQVGYHTSAESFFGLFGYYGSKRLTDDSFLSYNAEVHFANDFFGRDGIYDLSGRVGYTYNINQSLSMTPYLATAIALDGHEDGINFSGGLWIEVFF